jgi:hypothetical protein
MRAFTNIKTQSNLAVSLLSGQLIQLVIGFNEASEQKFMLPQYIIFQKETRYRTAAIASTPTWGVESNHSRTSGDSETIAFL